MRFPLSLSAGCLVIAFVASLVAAEPAAGESAALRAEVNAALDRADLPAAWFAARGWLEVAPQDPAPHLAAAQVYLRLNAPAAANAEALKRSASDRARYGTPAASSGGGSYSGPTARTWSASSVSVPSLAPAWTPSASQQMSNYRHNLNVQIMSVTRRP